MSIISFLLTALATYFILTTPRSAAWLRVLSVIVLWLYFLGNEGSFVLPLIVAIAAGLVKSSRDAEPNAGVAVPAGGYEPNPSISTPTPPPRAQPVERREPLSAADNPFSEPVSEPGSTRFENPFTDK